MNDKAEIALSAAGIGIVVSGAFLTHPWPPNFFMAIHWALASLGLVIYAAASLATFIGVLVVHSPNHKNLGQLTGYGVHQAPLINQHRLRSPLKLSRLGLTAALAALYEFGNWNTSYPSVLLGLALLCDIAGAVRAELWWREYREFTSLDTPPFKETLE